MERPEFDAARDIGDDTPRLRVELGAPFESLLFDVVAMLEHEARSRQDDGPTTDERINLQGIGARIMGFEASGNDSIYFPATVWGEWILWQTALLGVTRLVETLERGETDLTWWAAEVSNASDAARDAATRFADFAVGRQAADGD